MSEKLKELNTDEMLTLESLFDYAIRNNQIIHCKPLAGCATHIVTVDKPKREYPRPTYTMGHPQTGQGVNDHIYQHWAFWTAGNKYPWGMKPK